MGMVRVGKAGAAYESDYGAERHVSCMAEGLDGKGKFICGKNAVLQTQVAQRMQTYLARGESNSPKKLGKQWAMRGILAPGITNIFAIVFPMLLASYMLVAHFADFAGM